jgi:hypothetical protein
VIPQQIITNATPDQFAQIYENLNKGIRLSFGQLLENRRHRPWVAMAESMIRRGYPDADLIHRVWSAQFKKTKTRNELGFAFQVLAGAERGSSHFHLSFTKHLPLIMSEVPPTTEKVRTVLEMMASCDAEGTVPAKKKKDVFKKFIGAILHDFHTLSDVAWREKWTEFLPEAYNTISDSDMKAILNVGNLRASSNTRIEKVAENVWSYLSGNELDSVDTDSSEESD